jgi:hypothetical protein
VETDTENGNCHGSMAIQNRNIFCPPQDFRISVAHPDQQIFANPYILFLYQALGNMIGMFIPGLDFLSISDLGIPDLDAQHWLEVSRT